MLKTLYIFKNLPNFVMFFYHVFSNAVCYQRGAMFFGNVLHYADDAHIM